MAVAIPLLSRCCCYELKTGAQAMGLASVTCGVGCAIFYMYQYFAFVIAMRSSTVSLWGATALCLVGFVMMDLFVVLSVLLLLGIRKSKPWLVVPYLIFTGILTVLSALSIVVAPIVFGLAFDAYPLEVLAAVVGAPLATMLSVYFWLILYSFYINMKHSECYGNTDNFHSYGADDIEIT